jgi:hypothetical protein
LTIDLEQCTPKYIFPYVLVSHVNAFTHDASAVAHEEIPKP